MRDYAHADFYGTLTLAAFLEENRFSAGVLADSTGNIIKQIKGYLQQNSVRSIGLYCDFNNQTSVNTLSNWIKAHYDIPVIIGGPQAFALGNQFLIESNCDVIIRGEAELPILNVVEHYVHGTNDLADINGITYIDVSGGIHIGPDQDVIHNLDALPFPSARHVIQYDYSKKNAAIITGRGCPFSCAFCSECYGRKPVRYRSVGSVLDEIEHILSERPCVKYITFLDDTFILDFNRIEAFCSGLKRLRKNKEFHWFCTGHVRVLKHHPELIPLMVESGLARMQIGIDSGSQKVLDLYDKKITTNDIERVIAECVKYGLPQITTNMIIGGADESEDTVEETIHLVDHLLEIAKGRIDINSTYFWPFPNTPMTNDPEKYGIRIVDPHSYTSAGAYPTVETSTLSREQIVYHKRRLDEHIFKRMWELAAKIEHSVMYSQFELAYKYGIVSNWYNIVLRNDYYREYFSLVLKEGFSISFHLNEEALLDLFPMRLFQISDEVDGRMQINGVLYSIFESEIIRYSGGRLKTLQITDLLYGKYKADPDGWFPDNRVQDLSKNMVPPQKSRETIERRQFSRMVVEFLKALERKYLVIFASL
jgi:anaerobic magnesium-protoporphyrin IX monomethyl ester cyclase